MEYEIESVLEFAEKHMPLFKEKYEMYLAKPEDIIGRKVISIRGGYSMSEGGQIMIAEEIRDYRGVLHIHFKACEESKLYPYENLATHTGWTTEYDKRCESFVFYKKGMKI